MLFRSDSIKEAEADNIDKGQIICFFDTIAPQMPTLTQTVLKLSKANLLASMGDLDEVCQLLSRDTYEIAKQNKIEDFVKPAIAALANSDSDECKHMANLWSNALSPTTAMLSGASSSVPAHDVFLAKLKRYKASSLDICCAMAAKLVKTTSKANASSLLINSRLCFLI